MGSFVNKSTGVAFSVDDSKDERYIGDGYEAAAAPKPEPKKAPAKKSDSK